MSLIKSITNVTKILNSSHCRVLLALSLFLYSIVAEAADQTNIGDIDVMLDAGKSIIKVAAKWGGILTVVAAAIALGSGRLQGELSATVTKILIVIGLLAAAFGYFAPSIGWGFSF